ncbi:tetratricopeptide repeat protein [Mucilaginibacter ginsenosidivorans]|uniref:Tetratricopeptide repeat protein n=1 Tax=Mucilaginibacter ginsenosidivorans TaxID=398053 RepID=A0A5B8USK3_9SPHI|nr:tetratricopeptide repeat protein [Mucilaginibacter ginsenosidivorans]QEC61984.1 tetratricopeptide repeat protein [Mucilaginibacter ginsenosidivorans]
MSAQLLTDTQAAKWLGITKELLYAYVRNAPKKHLGHDRKLVTIVKESKNYFAVSDLRDFDKYLREPWSAPGDKRPEIPKYIKEYLITEIGGQCPITGKGAPLDNAHIEDYAVCFSHHHHNLIRIAKDEHTKADQGIIPKELLWQHKQRLVDQIRRKLSVEDNAFQSSLKPPLPHQLFLGRTADLEYLTALMETERMIVIQGIGGIGKTQLVLNALSSVGYHNPVLYFNIETVTDVKDLIILMQNGIFEITGKQGSKLFIEELSDTPITFIFDSLEKLLIPFRDEIEDVITDLMTKTTEVQLIVTTQVDLSLFDHQQHTIQLTGIDDGHALSILRYLLPAHLSLDGDDVYWITEFCNGHPLSLKLTASLIKFWADAKKAITKIREHHIVEQPLRRIQNKGTSLERCLSTAYDCLTTEEKKFLFIVQCHPAGVNINRFKTFSKDPQIDHHIASVNQFFFLESDFDELEFERISIPNPVRPFLNAMAEKFEGGIEEIQVEAYGQTMAEAVFFDAFFVEGWKDGPPAIGIIKLDDELPNILEAFHNSELRIKDLTRIENEVQRKYTSIVIGISTAMGKFCFTRGYFEYGIMFAKAGIRVNLLLNEIDIVAQQYMYLAQIYERQFDLKNFEATIAEMEVITARTGNKNMLVNINWAKGRFAMEHKNWAVAKKHYKTALGLMSKDNAKSADNRGSKMIGDFDQSTKQGNTALLNSEMGKVYEFSGELKEAIVYYKQAVEIQQKLSDETNLLSTYHHLGFCLIHTGAMDEGLDLLFKTVEGFYRNRQYEYLANTLSELGRIVVRRPDLLSNLLLDEEKIDVALEATCFQLQEIYERLISQMDQRAALEGVPNPLQGKILYLTMLVGVTPFRAALWHHIAPLFELMKTEEGEPDILLVVLTLGYVVGGFDDWKTQPIKEEVISQLYRICLIINGGPDLNGKTEIFQWLAFWMNLVGLTQDISAQELFNEALNSLTINRGL